MRGHRFVRTDDPIASFNAFDRIRANLPERRRQAVEILWYLGIPSSASAIRDEADRQGYSPRQAESIRRRANELEADGILYKVTPDDGTGAPLWFTEPIRTIPRLNGHYDNSQTPRRRLVRRRDPAG